MFNSDWKLTLTTTKFSITVVMDEGFWRSHTI